MTKIEVSGMVYEFSEEFGLINFLKENADRVYESSDASTNVLPPNAPLTMEEMREMGRRPVWFHWLHNDLTKTDMWRVISGVCEFTVYFTDDKGSGIIRDYGNTWLAYRREPEEAGKEKGKLI